MPESLLTLPPNAGRKIVQTGALLCCPLLGTGKFAGFCRKRGIRLDRKRLFRLEHSGVFGIEIIVLGGVGNATGRKKQDRLRAILRLIDYLHHHQTFTFLILDNENHAQRLKAEARKAKSIHGDRRYVTRPEYMRIWKESFEFDNFFLLHGDRGGAHGARRGHGRVSLQRCRECPSRRRFLLQPAIRLSTEGP